MLNDKDIYRAAKLTLDKYGVEAEQFALNMMEEFMAQGNTQASGAWLAIAQAIKKLDTSNPPSPVTVH